MEYNTAKKKIITKEYGRNIQQMVEYLLSIQDRELRNQQAKAVVNAMASLSNENKKTADFWQKIWDELFVISDYQLDIDSPFPIPAKKDAESKPERIEYPDHKIRFPSYGKNIERAIKELSEQENSPEKTEAIKAIAVYLKILYLHYNRDSVNDELIREHLRILSDGKLELENDYILPSNKSLLIRENEINSNLTGKMKFKSQPKANNQQPSKKKRRTKETSRLNSLMTE